MAMSGRPGLGLILTGWRMAIRDRPGLGSRLTGGRMAIRYCLEVGKTIGGLAEIVRGTCLLFAMVYVVKSMFFETFGPFFLFFRNIVLHGVFELHVC